MGKKPKYPLGTCFVTVGHALLTGKNPPKDLIVCHALLTATMPGQEGKIIAHTWLEFTNKENVKLAYDTTWDILFNSIWYRDYHKIKYLVEYTRVQYLELYQEYKNFGPWDPKIFDIAQAWHSFL